MSRLLRGHYSSVFAPTDSCVNPVWLSSTSAFGLVREVFAGCYQPLLLPGSSRRYLCESFPRCPSQCPGGLLSAFAWFFPSIHRPSPSFDWVGFPRPSVNTTFHGSAFEAAAISFMFRPPGLLASQIVPTAASSPAGQPRLFTSEQNVRRYLRTHRTCYPPDHRQLAERELSSRKIRSLVGCYRMMPTFPPLPLKSRTVGFTQYGFKVEISGGAFPSTTSASRGLPPPFVHLAFQRLILVLSRGTRCEYEEGVRSAGAEIAETEWLGVTSGRKAGSGSPK